MIFSMVALLDLGVSVESLFSLLNLTSLESHLKSLSQGALWMVPERQHAHPTAHSPSLGVHRSVWLPCKWEVPLALFTMYS